MYRAASIAVAFLVFSFGFILQTEALNLGCQAEFFNLAFKSYKVSRATSSEIQKIITRNVDQKIILNEVYDYLDKNYVSESDAMYILDNLPLGVEWGRRSGSSSHVRSYFAEHIGRAKIKGEFISIDLEILFLLVSNTKFSDLSKFDEFVKKVLSHLPKTYTFKSWKKSKTTNFMQDSYRMIARLSRLYVDRYGSAHPYLSPVGHIPMLMEYFSDADPTSKVAILSDAFDQTEIIIKLSPADFERVLDYLPGDQGWQRVNGIPEIKAFMDNDTESSTKWGLGKNMPVDVLVLLKAMDALERYLDGPVIANTRNMIISMIPKLLKALDHSDETKSKKLEYVIDLKASYVSRLFQVAGQGRDKAFDDGNPEANYIHWLMTWDDLSPVRSSGMPRFGKTAARKKELLVERLKKYVQLKSRINEAELLFIVENFPKLRSETIDGGDDQIVGILNRELKTEWNESGLESELGRWLVVMLINKLDRISADKVSAAKEGLEKVLGNVSSRRTMSHQFFADINKLIAHLLEQKSGATGTSLVLVDTSPDKDDSIEAFEQSLNSHELNLYRLSLENFGLRKAQARELVQAVRMFQVDFNDYRQLKSRYRIHSVAMIIAKRRGRDKDLILQRYDAEFMREYESLVGVLEEINRFSFSTSEKPEIDEKLNRLDSDYFELAEIYGRSVFGVGRINSIIFSVYERLRSLLEIYKENDQSDLSLGDLNQRRIKVLEELLEFQNYLDMSFEIMFPLNQRAEEAGSRFESLIDYLQKRVDGGGLDAGYLDLAQQKIASLRSIQGQFTTMASLISLEYQRVQMAIESIKSMRKFITDMDISSVTGDRVPWPDFQDIDNHVLPLRSPQAK